MYAIKINRFSPLKPPASVVIGIGSIEKRYSRYLEKCYNDAKAVIMPTVLDNADKEKVDITASVSQVDFLKAARFLQEICSIYTAANQGKRLEIDNDFRELKGVRIPYITCLVNLIKEDQYTLSLISSYFEKKITTIPKVGYINHKGRLQ